MYVRKVVMKTTFSEPLSLLCTILVKKYRATLVKFQYLATNSAFVCGTERFYACT